jgi:hypothetical protein
MYENPGVITSLPMGKSKAINAICKASVPLAQGITCLAPKYSLKLLANAFTSGPLI